jgi:hypothetical protein
VVVWVAYLLLGALGLYSLTRLNTSLPAEAIQLVGEILLILGIGLSLTMALLHWRLLIALSARAADTIAGQRRRGDWDLIAITPVSKTRWFKGQLISMAWQVFPLVRQLLAVHLLMILLGTAVLVYAIAEARNNDWASDHSLAIGVYIVAVIPFGLLLLAMPFLNTALFGMASLYTSSHSKRVTMSMLYSFVLVYATRVLMSLSFIWGGAMLLIVLGGVANWLGLTDSFDTDLNDLLTVSAGVLALACVYSLAAAFFIEWLPVLGFILMASPAEDAATHAVLYLAIWLTLLFTYGLLPLLLLRGMGRAVVWQINQRER